MFFLKHNHGITKIATRIYDRLFSMYLTNLNKKKKLLKLSGERLAKINIYLTKFMLFNYLFYKNLKNLQNLYVKTD